MLVSKARAKGSDDDATIQLYRIDELRWPGATGEHCSEGARARATSGAEGKLEGFTLSTELHVIPEPHSPGRGRDHRATSCAEASIGRLCAITRISRRFVLEEWVARRVDSAHILKASPIDRARTHLFVAMEYVEGQTLAQWMIDHPRPTLDRVRAIIEQVAKDTGLAQQGNAAPGHS